MRSGRSGGAAGGGGQVLLTLLFGRRCGPVSPQCSGCSDGGLGSSSSGGCGGGGSIGRWLGRVGGIGGPQGGGGRRRRRLAVGVDLGAERQYLPGDGSQGGAERLVGFLRRVFAGRWPFRSIPLGGGRGGQLHCGEI